MNINEKTWKFVCEHADEDVRKVALQGTKDPEVDLQMALQQIAGRQTARKKLPSWATQEGIVYPPHLNMEQCSSEQTARYKAKIVNSKWPNCKSFVDLTGGFGVDFARIWPSLEIVDVRRFAVTRVTELCVEMINLSKSDVATRASMLAYNLWLLTRPIGSAVKK